MTISEREATAALPAFNLLGFGMTPDEAVADLIDERMAQRDIAALDAEPAHELLGQHRSARASDDVGGD